MDLRQNNITLELKLPIETFLTCLVETHDARVDYNIISTVTHADNNLGSLATNGQDVDA